VAPAVIEEFKSMMANIEAATTVENKLHAIAAGLEAVASTIKQAL
jgi:hypothetical protein